MWADLCEFVERAESPRITVVGDVMLDTYVWGEVSRISPEGPIPVVHVREKEYRPGGAASVAAMLAALGAQVRCVGVIGDDLEGSRLSQKMKDAGVDVSGLVTCNDRPTIVKSRFLGYVQTAGRSLQQIVRVDEEDVKSLPQAAVDKVLEQTTTDEEDFVVVEDMSKGLFTPELVGQIVEWSDLESKPLLVDPEKGEDYARYTGADYIVPNRAETETATGIKLDGVSAYRQAAAQLLDTLNLEAAIIKLDRDGIFFATAEGVDKHVPTTALEVADVTGAGDMVAASVSFALAAGRSLSEAVTLANVAAGIEVSRQGATAVSRKELREGLRAQADPSSRKIKSRDEIRQIVKDARARGQKVAFTNGCFDLLHLGHVELIRHASRQGDLLVVATNTDRSTKELKGSGRPINTEDVRTKILAALSDVDYVVLFDETSVLPLIKELRPDVLVKGGDYGKEGVVGHDFVESYGGEVKLAPRVEGLSTTELVERIARNHGNDST